MADGWQWYTTEKSGWKEGTIKSVDCGNGRETKQVEYYILPDDVNQTVKDLGPNPWQDDVPDQLWTNLGLDIEELAVAVQRALDENGCKKGEKDIEVRPHPDSGDYLCGFITYESLAQAFVNKYSARVVFCHVPGWRGDHGVGRDFVYSLVGQIAKHWG